MLRCIIDTVIRGLLWVPGLFRFFPWYVLLYSKLQEGIAYCCRAQWYFTGDRWPRSTVSACIQSSIEKAPSR